MPTLSLPTLVKSVNVAPFFHLSSSAPDTRPPPSSTVLIAEVNDNGLLLRPAIAVPVEIYSPERKAELLLSTAVDEDDYARARKAVLDMGLDPDEIPHYCPDQG
jgi:hypothetical protein